MKIKQLQISNILSFKYVSEIDRATSIIFDESLNILIGENGAGKSTALEIINFIFKKVLFTQFNVNQDLYSRKGALNNPDKKQILSAANNRSYSGFRMDPNWNTEDESQKIKLVIQLDEIDKKNIRNLILNKEKLRILASLYASEFVDPSTALLSEYTIDIELNKTDKTFTTRISPNNSDPGFLYLVNYNFYKELISFYNLENPDGQIAPLYESFVLIGGYRNYNAFNPSVSLQNAHASQQIQQIKTQEYSKSLNSSEQSEPVIFNLVRLRVAEKHFEIFGSTLDKDQCEIEVNKIPFLLSINKRLELVGLECKIRLIEQRTWQYAFEFLDIKRKKVLHDINSLSAGQKAIIHLVFEAYGRGDLKGGLVIIDEPEIHLHYQFQNEYLRVINEINKEQGCQYILVTHSESLINSITIHKVKRLALDKDNYTVVKSPVLTTDQRFLIKILDNTRSTYAFFSKKILLVEGDTDRYFFKAIIQEVRPEFNQEISVLDIGGKGAYAEWKDFFVAFGLSVYFVGDLDSAFNFLYPFESMYKLNSPGAITGFKCAHPNLESSINQKYSEGVFILKEGDLEEYLNIHNKGLPETIMFCETQLKKFLADKSNQKSKEINFIVDQIIS